MHLPANGADGKDASSKDASGDPTSNGEEGEEDNEEDAGDIGALANMLENLDDFVLEPAPQGTIVKCRITRDRKGMDRGRRRRSKPS